uniref:HDAg domain-containing protein n=1 Tax=Parascaris univalens TaxID=6257 RepID=A0A914ZK98_PARUN
MLMPSAQLRDLDLVKWLDNKLGDNNELWSGRQAASLLSREMLVELETCFQALETHVKLKIVLALPHLSYRLMTMWKGPLMNLLDLARRDADDWIETVSNMYRDFPSRRCVIPLPSDPNSYFCRTLDELKKAVKKHSQEDDLRLLPLDKCVVSQSAIKCRYGVGEVDIRKHFNLRRRAKSSTLKADVVRSAESGVNPAKNQKMGAFTTSFPIRIRSTARKPNNDLPMRGIPAVNTCKLSAGFTNEPRKFQRQLVKREGGAKLIDIGEIPHALKQRRREQEAEEKAKKLLEKQELKKKHQAEKAEREARRSAAVKFEPTHNNDESAKAGPSVPTVSAAPREQIAEPASEQAASPRPEKQPSYADVRERPTMGCEQPVVVASVQSRIEQRDAALRRQCDEMLSSANALDAQGRRMVSAFLSGNKAHPFPHMGDVVTLKLSETYEDENRLDGSTQKIRVETYFQMDYHTGEWKRLRKTRVLRPEEVSMLQTTFDFAAMPFGLPQRFT